MLHSTLGPLSAHKHKGAVNFYKTPPNHLVKQFLKNEKLIKQKSARQISEHNVFVQYVQRGERKRVT
jgi:hypothetical protein